jgi:hypothetical protein
LVADTGDARVAALLKKLGEKYKVAVGLHAEEGAARKKNLVKKDGEVSEVEESQTLVDVGSQHEFGLGAPRRSFVGDWFDQSQTQAEKLLRRAARMSIANNADEKQALLKMAAWAVGAMQQRIADGIQPELSPERKAEKKALTGQAKDTALILTGQLRSSLRGRVLPL